MRIFFKKKIPKFIVLHFCDWFLNIGWKIFFLKGYDYSEDVPAKPGKKILLKKFHSPGKKLGPLFCKKKWHDKKTCKKKCWHYFFKKKFKSFFCSDNCCDWFEKKSIDFFSKIFFFKKSKLFFLNISWSTSNKYKLFSKNFFLKKFESPQKNNF